MLHFLLGESAAEYRAVASGVGGTLAIWWRAKIIKVPDASSSSTFCLLHLGIRATEENNAVKHWMEQAALTWRRDRLRSAPIVGFGPPRLVAKARK